LAVAALYLWSERGRIVKAPPTVSAPAPAPVASASLTPKPAADANDAEREWREATADWLEKRGDPESLMAAFVLFHQNSAASGEVRRRMATLVARASDGATSDASLQLLALAACRWMQRSEENACDANQYEQRVIAADRGNSVALLEMLARANKAGDVNAQ